MPGDTISDVDPTANQSYEMHEDRVGERKGDNEVSMADSRLVRSLSARLLQGQTCHDSSGTIVKVNRLGSYNTIEQSEKLRPSYSPEHKFLF